MPKKVLIPGWSTQAQFLQGCGCIIFDFCWYSVVSASSLLTDQDFGNALCHCDTHDCWLPGECWGVHRARGDLWPVQRPSLNTTSSAAVERGNWCSDPGMHWAVTEWQERCHSTGIRQARADFPHQEWFLRNGLKATFFSASLGIKSCRAVSFLCWIGVTQSMIGAFSDPGSYFCPLQVFGGGVSPGPTMGNYLSFSTYANH